MNRPFRRRRGITSVLAMLFMVLIGTLSLGFYATVTTSTALAGNDRRTAKALMAAESGLQFMRLQLANVEIPPNTQPTDLLNELFEDLTVPDGSGESPADRIDGNLTGGASIVRDGNVIRIPAQPDAMIMTNTLDNSGFRITITDVGSVGEIVCTVTGRSGSEIVSTKGVRLDFSRQPHETDLFDNAVASRGRMLMQKGAILGVPGISDNSIANIMSSRDVDGALVVSGGVVGGTLGIVGADPDDKSNAWITGGNVSGTSNLTTIRNDYLKVQSEPPFPIVDTTIRNDYLKVQSEPPFPIVDTTVFAPYATNTYSGGNDKTLQNLRIPANTGTAANPLKFNGNTTIEGILYIESPNHIDFAGNTTLAGFIVFEKANSESSNTLTMSGNFKVGNLPLGQDFDPLRSITGIAIVAPEAAVKFTGSADSQFRGNLIVGTFKNEGSADIQIDRGSIVSLEESGNAVVFNGKSVRFTSTGKDNQPPTGLLYSEKFAPSKGSYLELN